MARTIIDIPADQLREVDALCQLLGISRAEAVRRALRDYAHCNGHVKADAFGLWEAEPPASGPAPVTGPAP